MLPAPLRDRFGFTAHLDYYETDELHTIVTRSAVQLGIVADSQSCAELASRSRGTPRIANRLLRRARDYAQVHHDGVLDVERTRSALELYEVDEIGLDRLDRAVLVALIDNFAGGPVGLSTLAMAVGEEPETVETVCEPFLVRQGFMTRTPRGRTATSASFEALGRPVPEWSNRLDPS
jgi:Holliday junction DNA helicase RuvB